MAKLCITPQSPAVTAPANRGGGLWHCIKLCKSPFPHRLHHYAKGSPTRGAGAKRLRGFVQQKKALTLQGR